jgi:hypothetical protein
MPTGDGELPQEKSTEKLKGHCIGEFLVYKYNYAFSERATNFTYSVQQVG